MKLRVLAGVMAIGAGVTSVVVATPTADAAPAPSVRVCASWFDGRPYHGGVTLVNRNWWEIGRTQGTTGNGCTVFRNVRPLTTYRVLVNTEIKPCSQALRPDGSWYKTGTKRDAVGSSRWQTTPRHGQVDLGRFRVNISEQLCQ
ncbi:hypothetical protein [Gordonia sp. ABSL49_1]|nr:hypothetical protein [Gordonia sp. ABSL49_1]MCH5641909.1 hypothetical protein [Gordonia sp. ABSL49_1]